MRPVVEAIAVPHDTPAKVTDHATSTSVSRALNPSPAANVVCRLQATNEKITERIPIGSSMGLVDSWLALLPFKVYSHPSRELLTEAPYAMSEMAGPRFTVRPEEYGSLKTPCLLQMVGYKMLSGRRTTYEWSVRSADGLTV